MAATITSIDQWSSEAELVFDSDPDRIPTVVHMAKLRPSAECISALPDRFLSDREAVEVSSNVLSALRVLADQNAADAHAK